MSAASPLYPTALGPSWASLPVLLQRFYAGPDPASAVGVFRVQHGKSWLARLLAPFSGLPPEAEAIETQLLVTRSETGERWRRRFGDHVMETHQELNLGGLTERLGPVELRLGLRVEDGRLLIQSTAVSLRVGPWRLRVPRLLAPRADGVSWASDGVVHASIALHLPLAGLLVRYEGTLQLLGGR